VSYQAGNAPALDVVESDGSAPVDFMAAFAAPCRRILPLEDGELTLTVVGGASRTITVQALVAEDIQARAVTSTGVPLRAYK
jgi:hypothetical protein